MARKNSQKTDTSGAIVFDSRTKAVMAQVGQDNVKEKVQAVKEVVPGRSNNEMILVLQYYDYCVESTIQAYLEDGAKEALKEWHFSENKVSKHKKKKSKKSQSNQNQNQNQSADQQKSNSQAQANNNTNARLSNGIVNGHGPAGINSTVLIGKNVNRTGVVVSSSSSSSSLSRGDSHAAASTSPKEEGSSNKDLNDSAAAAAAATGASKSESAIDNESERHKHTIQSPEPAAASPIPDTYHGSQESSTNAADLPRVRPGLEKSSKDLHRQTVALERLQLVLTEEINKAYKRIKTVFEEMQTCLRERETWLNKEMDLVKVDAMETLKQRQQKAVDLKEEVDRASQLSESDVAELRLQIKQFVSDRRIDDDLGRTTRFTYDSDHLAAEIKSFGEVIAVNKCAYSNSSRPSTSVSVSSSQDTLPPPIPAQVLSTSANISTESNDTNHVLSSEGATSKTIPNSDQETSQKQTEVAEPVQKENSPESLPNNDQFSTTNYRLILHTESRTFSSRRRPTRKNYQNTGNRDYGSRGGSNQRGGGRGGGGGGGYFNTYPHERIQYLGRGVRRSRPYRGGGGGGRGEMRGNYSPRPTSQRGGGRGEMRNNNYAPRPTSTQTVTTLNK